MTTTWDASKRQGNFAKRGYDFADLDTHLWRGSPMADTAPKPDRREIGFFQEDRDEVCDGPELAKSEATDLRPVRAVPEIHALLPKRDAGVPSVRIRR